MSLGPVVSCCSDPMLRGGRCFNCGKWLEEEETTMTDWYRVKKLARPSPDFPGYRVYLFGSMQKCSEEWLGLFRAEAVARGMLVEVMARPRQSALVYVLVPEGR